MPETTVPEGSVPYEQTWDATYGMAIREASGSRAVGAVARAEELCEPRSGIVNGGLYASMAETLASYATAMAVYERGAIAVGMYNSTNVTRFVSSGALTAVATARTRGESEWLWDVEVTDAAGEVCAVSNVRIAVRPRPGG